MAVRFRISQGQYLSFISSDLSTYINAGLTAGDVIGVIAQVRIDSTSSSWGTDGATSVVSLGKSTSPYQAYSGAVSGDFGSDAVSLTFTTSNFFIRSRGNICCNAGGAVAAGSTTGVCWLIDSDDDHALSANATSPTVDTTFSGVTSGTNRVWEWPSPVDMIALGTAASTDAGDTDRTCGCAVEHVAIVRAPLATFTANTNAVIKQCIGDGVTMLTPRDIFDDEDIIAYWPLTENLDSEIVNGSESSAWTFTQSDGSSAPEFESFDDWGLGQYRQPAKESITASDLSGAFLGSFKPSTIRASRTAKKRTVYDGPTAAGTTVDNGWRTPQDVLIRGITPDGDGVQAAEGEGGEHVRPWAISAAGVQIGVGSSTARAYTRAQGASSWTRTSDTTAWSGLWTFPDSENVIGYASGFYLTSVADIVAGTAPTAATSDVTLVTGGTITTPATGTGTVDVNEAVSLTSVGTGPGGIACFAAYSNPATDHVRKIWTTNDSGANWTEVFDAEDSTWNTDWDSEIAGTDNKLQPKHFHGPVWVASESKWYCLYGDSYAQSGAITCGSDPSSPGTDVVTNWQLRSAQPFGPSLYKEKIIGGSDRNEGHGYNDPTSGDFVGLERMLPPVISARHGFHTAVGGGYGYFLPHPESPDSYPVSSTPIMAIKDLSGLVQVPYMMTRYELGNAGICVMDNDAGINDGAWSFEISDGGTFKHFKLTLPKLRTAKGFAVLPARANYFEGTMDGDNSGSGTAVWASTGDYTSRGQIADPDGTSSLAIKGVIGSGNQDQTSEISLLRSNFQNPGTHIVTPGVGFAAYFSADIPLDVNVGFGMHSSTTTNANEAIEADSRWKRIRTLSALWGTVDQFAINASVAANVSNNDGYGEFYTGTLNGEIQIANIMLGRVPIIDVHVPAVNGNAGETNWAAQKATYYEFDKTTDAEWSYLMHVTPLNSWWEYLGNVTNDRHVIAEFEIANGRKVALEALPVAYSTVDGVTGASSENISFAAGITEADMVGNVVRTAPNQTVTPDTNYISARTDGDDVTLDAGTYTAPSTSDHAWVEALSLYVVEYDTDGTTEVTSERLGRFNVQYGVAIPLAISFTSDGKAAAYHAAEGKGVIGTGISLNGSADFTETNVTFRHGSNVNVERIMPHYCTVVDYYNEDLASKTELAAKFDAAAVDASSNRRRRIILGF